jgi:hypothetical protein
MEFLLRWMSQNWHSFTVTACCLDDLTLLWAKADQCYVDEMHAVILVQV